MENVLVSVPSAGIEPATRGLRNRCAARAACEIVGIRYLAANGRRPFMDRVMMSERVFQRYGSSADRS